MSVSINVTIDNIMDAIGVFIQQFAPLAQIVRGQQNRVALPTDPTVVLTELMSVDLETSSHFMDNINQQVTIFTPCRIDIQVDFYGSVSGDYCRMLKNAFRSSYAVDQFNSYTAENNLGTIVPLYCSDGLQHPLITAEDQSETRWTLTISLQYNPTVEIAQQSATAAKINGFTAVDLNWK